MKTIFLMRHAEPKRLPDVSQEGWPLSDYGQESAKRCFGQRLLKTAVHVYASPFLRALQTAQHSDLPMTVDYRLAERRTGINVPEFGDCWLRQYGDGAFKCPDGESFDEVAQRMQACMNDILTALNDGESAIVVSHAAAICAYLKKKCSISVTDRATKRREIVWRNQTVYEGTIPPLTCFKLTFCQGTLMNVEIPLP